MICNDCGKEIPDSSIFCEYCGFKISEEEIEKENIDDVNEVLEIPKRNEEAFKEALQEKNERIEKLKKDIFRARLDQNRKFKAKITILFILLLISIFILIVMGSRLSVVSLKYNKLYSENDKLLSENEDLEKEKNNILEDYDELEKKYNNLQDINSNNAEEVSQEENGEIDENVAEEKVPTVRLEIYEGPIYEKSTAICYYRIRAIVTGNPAPKIVFSKDDSGSSWGPNISQVNLTKPEDVYVLTVNASNKLGESSDSILLSWGCNE